MGIIEVCAISVALAMDCFTVSIVSGISAKKVYFEKMASMVILFGVFQGGMAWAGWYAGSLIYYLIASFDHWIAFGLLACLGVQMIWNGIKETSTESQPLSFPIIFAMAIATSIDALAVGISMSCLQLNTWQTIIMPCGIIAAFSSLFTVIGLAIGIFAGRSIPLKIEPLGGILLISIGIKILITHLS